MVFNIYWMTSSLEWEQLNCITHLLIVPKVWSIIDGTAGNPLWFNGKKDQISGISRPYLGLEIPPIWFGFFASGLPAAPSFTEEALKTDRLCYVRLNHLLNI